MSCNCNNKQVETQYIGDVQVDALSTLPEYLLAERDVEDELSGDTVRSLVRVPTSKILPNGNGCNVFTISTDDDSLVVPENQVRGGMFYDGKVMYNYDDVDGNAMFLLIGRVGDKVLCQRTGVVTFPEGHEYIVGAQYYATNNNGEPSTDSTQYTHKLFIPISRTQLLINLP